MNIPSLLRVEEHNALAGITLSGRVLDLGGDKHSEYLRFFNGTFETTTLNLSEAVQPDIVHDLEQPLPIADGLYDHVLLINVLEHIFDYRALLRETVRVVKLGGSVVVVVPFLFPVHPSPNDYHRFTSSALEKEFRLVGLRAISIRALGGGVFASRYLLLDRLLPKPLRIVNFYTCRYIVAALDACLEKIAHASGKKYDKKNYALGYAALGIKG